MTWHEAADHQRFIFRDPEFQNAEASESGDRDGSQKRLPPRPPKTALVFIRFQNLVVLTSNESGIIRTAS